LIGFKSLIMTILLFSIGLVASALGLLFLTRIERIRADIRANIFVEEIQQAKPKQQRTKKRPQHAHA
jgi:UPF0716 family protein affecting phage T7 exclusion